MSGKIYIVRHGQVANPKNILYGRLKGFNLSDEGRKQITLTGQFLQGKKISKIYASPLLRTRQTAKIINKIINLTAISHSRNLIDVKTSYQGKSFSFVKSLNFDFYSTENRQPGDETIKDISLRMREFFFRITKKHIGENIVIVTHAEPLLILRSTLLNQPLTLTSLRSFTPYYGEVFEIKKNPKNSFIIRSVFHP